MRYRDTYQMADAVCSLIMDPALAARLGAEVRALALTKMDPATLMARDQAECRKLLQL